MYKITDSQYSYWSHETFAAFVEAFWTFLVVTDGNQIDYFTIYEFEIRRVSGHFSKSESPMNSVSSIHY